MSTMTDRLAELDRRYQELTQQLADPEVSTDPARLQAIGMERADLEEVVAAYQDMKALERQIQEAQAIVSEESDPEMVAMAREELDELHNSARAADDAGTLLCSSRRTRTTRRILSSRSGLEPAVMRLGCSRLS